MTKKSKEAEMEFLHQVVRVLSLEAGSQKSFGKRLSMKELTHLGPFGGLGLCPSPSGLLRVGVCLVGVEQWVHGSSRAPGRVFQKCFEKGSEMSNVC